MARSDSRSLARINTCGFANKSACTSSDKIVVITNTTTTADLVQWNNFNVNVINEICN